MDHLISYTPCFQSYMYWNFRVYLYGGSFSKKDYIKVCHFLVPSRRVQDWQTKRNRSTKINGTWMDFVQHTLVKNTIVNCSQINWQCNLLYLEEKKIWCNTINCSALPQNIGPPIGDTNGIIGNVFEHKSKLHVHNCTLPIKHCHFLDTPQQRIYLSA